MQVQNLRAKICSEMPRIYDCKVFRGQHENSSEDSGMCRVPESRIFTGRPCV